MSQIRISLSELNACARNLRDALSAYRSAVNQANAAADALSTKWKGASRDVFVEEQEKAYRWHGTLEQIVEELIDSLRNAADQYALAESNVRKGIQ